MCDIGVRSGKVRSGVYRCGRYYIVKSPTSGWWWIQLGLKGDNIELAIHKPFDTLNAAYYWGRNNP